MPTYDRSFPVLTEDKLGKLLDDLLLYGGSDVRSVQSVSPSTAFRIPGYGYTALNSTAAKTWTMDFPDPPNRKFFIQTSSSTLAKVVQLATTAATFDGTNHVMTFNALADSIELVAISTTRYAIISNSSVDLTTV